MKKYCTAVLLSLFVMAVFAESRETLKSLENQKEIQDIPANTKVLTGSTAAQITQAPASGHENWIIEAAFIEKSFFQGLADSFYSNIIEEERYLLIFHGLKATIIISILATLLGTLFGGLICFMRMSRKKVLQVTSKLYISILVGTPVLVVLMIIFYVVFASVDIDPIMVAVIAFGLNFAAYFAEMFRSAIEGVDKGQSEAGIALGFSKVKTFVYIVMPQAIRRILPVYKGEVITLVKMTSVVGYIAVMDLTKAGDMIRSRTFDAFFPLIMVAVVYFLISWLIASSLGYAERKTNPKFNKSRIQAND